MTALVWHSIIALQGWRHADDTSSFTTAILDEKMQVFTVASHGALHDVNKLRLCFQEARI